MAKNPFDRIAKNPEKYAVYASEVMLKGFETDTVEFWLDGLYDDHPFQGGKEDPDRPVHGTRYMMFVVEIGDDQQPINVDMRKKFISATKETFKSETTASTIVKNAAMLCQDRDFHRFVYSRIKKMGIEEQSAFIMSGIPMYLTAQKVESMNDPKKAEEWCKYYIYHRCGITSRRQLGFYVQKRNKFHLVEKEFYEWGNQRGAA